MTSDIHDSDALARLRRIDRLADEFETAWRRGDRPLIEDLLAQSEPRDRDELLRLLLPLEWELLADHQWTPTDLDRYRARFPEATELLAELSVVVSASLKSEPLLPDHAAVWRQLQSAGLVDGSPPVATDSAAVRELLDRLLAAGTVSDLQARIAAGELDLPLAFGTYVLTEELGAGGMGRVYRATHRLMDRSVAIKFLDADSEFSPEGRKRFLQEIRAVSRLNHPGIVASLDADFCEDRPYLVMELVDGINLRELVREQGPLGEREALQIAREVADAMADAHARGILHRDLKPSNIMRLPSGRTKVLDLGLARLTDETGRRTHSTLTRPETFAGTPDYISPEQAWAPETVDARSDVYSLGCTLHFLLTAEPPFPAPSAWITLLAHRDAPRPSVQSKRSNLSPYTAALLQSMISAQPEGRPGSMAECVRQIDQILSGRPSAPFRIAARSLQRRGQWLFALFGVMGIAASVYQWSQPVPTTPLASNRPGVSTTERPPTAPASAPQATSTSPSPVVPAAVTRDSVEGISSVSRSPKYVWSETSTVYHDADCWAIKRILPANRREGNTPPPGKTRHTCRASLADDTQQVPSTVPDLPGAISLPSRLDPTLSHGPALAGLFEREHVDLLANLDLPRDSYQGAWTLHDGVLRNEIEQSRIMLPDVVPESYQLSLRFVRLSGHDGVAVSLPVRGSLCELNLAGFFGRAHGLQTIDGRPFDDNATTVRPGRLVNEREYALEIRVLGNDDARTARIEVDLDGRPLMEWDGEVQKLSAGAYPPTDRTKIALGASNCLAEFRAVHLSPRYQRTIPSSGK
jgi:serine/threonine protein kinase